MDVVLSEWQDYRGWRFVDPSEEKIRELINALLRATDEEQARTRGEELRVAIRVHLKRVHDQLKTMAASSRSQRR